MDIPENIPDEIPEPVSYSKKSNESKARENIIEDIMSWKEEEVRNRSSTDYPDEFENMDEYIEKYREDLHDLTTEKLIKRYRETVASWFMHRDDTMRVCSRLELQDDVSDTDEFIDLQLYYVITGQYKNKSYGFVY